MHLPRAKPLTLSLGALALLGVAPAHASTNITAFNVSGGTVRTDYSGTIGYAFTTSMLETVTSLGYYVASGTLQDSHTVDLYTAGGTLLDSATISAGTYTPGTFLFDAISPLTLTAGSYVLAANTGPELSPSPSGGNVHDGFLDGATVTTAPGVTYDNGLYSTPGGTGGSVTFPTNVEPYGGSGYFGPNMEISPAPEPSQIGMLALMGLGLGGLMLRARKAKAALA